MNIGMKVEDVRTRGGQMTAKAMQEYKELKQCMDQFVKNELPTLWQGAGSDAYVKRYEQLLPSFNAIEQLITDIGAGIQNNAAYYEEADQAASSAISQS